MDEYKFLYSEYLPFKRFGFDSIDELFSSLPELLQVKNSASGGGLMIVPNKDHVQAWQLEEDRNRGEED